jgi:hypothetical protein
VPPDGLELQSGYALLPFQPILPVPSSSLLSLSSSFLLLLVCYTNFKEVSVSPIIGTKGSYVRWPGKLGLKLIQRRQ